MKQKEIFLCKYGEIVLKGANRRYFEECMLHFVEAHMSDFYMDKAKVEK